MNNNIYANLSTWFKQCPLFKDWIFFNTIPLEPNAVSITSVQNTPSVNEFIDGAKEVELLFNLNIVKDYDANGTSDLNLEAMDYFEQVTRWIELQSASNNFPQGTDNIVIYEVLSAYTNPEVYLNEDSGLARYEGQYKLSYLERK